MANFIIHAFLIFNDNLQLVITFLKFFTKHIIINISARINSASWFIFIHFLFRNSHYYFESSNTFKLIYCLWTRKWEDISLFSYLPRPKGQSYNSPLLLPDIGSNWLVNKSMTSIAKSRIKLTEINLKS